MTPTLGDFLTIFGNVEPYLPANTSQLLNAYINMTQVSTEYVLYYMFSISRFLCYLNLLRSEIPHFFAVIHNAGKVWAEACCRGTVRGFAFALCNASVE